MLRYCSPFLFLAGIPLLYYLAGPFWPLAIVTLLPAVLIGVEWLPVRPGPARPLSRRGFYLLPLALGNFCGPLLLGTFFDTIGRRKMIGGTFAIKNADGSTAMLEMVRASGNAPEPGTHLVRRGL